MIMKNMRLGLACLGLLMAVNVRANVAVNVTIDSTMLMIGDQSGLSLSVNQPENKYVTFPLYVDTFPGGLEIIELPQVDTVKEGERWVVTHNYRITAFEDSLYLLTAMPFVCEGETIWSEPVALKVIQPFEVDTASHILADIKDIYRAPIYWWGIMRVVLLVLLILAVSGLIYWLYRRYAKNGTNENPVEQVEMRDPWEVAMEGLDRIKQEKTWQQSGRQKVYFTELTDVLRIYTEGVFGVNGMELPSSEILKEITPLLKDNKEALLLLKAVLNLADLVKFAKWTALPDECEASLKQAYQFVELTHKVPAEEQTQEEKIVKE